ncbi:unnamed protein product, partial [Menidia menidia]
MAASNYTLKVNRGLLDPNFESYRLSLDAIPTYNVELDAAVEEVKLKDSQYTLEHMRAFGMFNYLHLDPWYQDSVLFVDCKGRVLNLTVTLDTALGKPREVFSLGAEPGRGGERVCPSLSLTSATWAALLSHVQEGVHAVEVLLLRVQKDPPDTPGSGFSVSLEWIT